MKLSNKSLPLVSVIIPIFNSIHYIDGFMKSLLSTEYSNIEYILVDDGSTDGTKERIVNLSSKHSEIKVVETLRRIGLTKSRNMAIQMSRGKYLAFAEADMEFDKNWILEAVSVLEIDSKIGGVAGKVLDIKHKDTLQAMGIRIIPQIGWVVSVGLGELGKNYMDGYEASLGAVGSVVRRSVVQLIRGFDEEMDRIDDLDFGWRIWISGNRVVTVPGSVTYHVTVKSWNVRKSSVTRIQQEIALARVLRMMVKNYEAINILRYFPQALVVLSARAVINLLKGNIYSGLCLILAFLWFIRTFPSTWQERRYNQKIRGFTDAEIYKSIMVQQNLLEFFYSYQKNLNKKLERLL